MRPENEFLKNCLLTVITLMCLLAFVDKANASDKFIDVSFGGYSKHLYPTYKDFDRVKKPYNDTHNLIGIEYRDYNSGYGMFAFSNSYYDQSVAVVKSYYFHPTDYAEVITSIGAVTGYENRDGCIMGVGSLCTMASVGIQFGTGKLKGRITWYGTAFVLTGTWRF